MKSFFQLKTHNRASLINVNSNYLELLHIQD